MDPIISLEKFRRESLLDRVENAVDNYIQELSCRDCANELRQRYMDELTDPTCDIDDLDDFVSEYHDDDTF